MFVVCILMFGNAVYIISESFLDQRSDNYQTEKDVEADGSNEIITAAFNNRFIDALLG